MNYVRRKIGPAFRQALTQFPVCVLTGARQTGKSTFLRQELDGYAYVTFDDPLLREFAQSDPRGFLTQYHGAKGTILDEIQYVPELLPYLKMDVDNLRVPGRWVLTGSQQFHLMRNIGESLAGRAALFDMAPFCSTEISSPQNIEKLLWNGCYPEPAMEPQKRDLWIPSYIQTYIERDIRLLGNVNDIHSFETLVRLCAARHGQELNVATLSRESGVAVATAKKWIGLMESCYLIELIPPFHNNLGKRLIKSPKMYFSDSALAAYLTQQPSPRALKAGSMGGAFFEGWVISEAIKCFYNHGRKPDIFFWRTHDGLEVDLIIQIKGRLHPIEIKQSATPKPQFMEPINRFRQLAERQYEVAEGLLVCQAEEQAALPNGNRCMPWRNLYPWLEEQLEAPCTTAPEIEYMSLASTTKSNSAPPSSR
jgi:uncharacterized protein